MHSLPKFKIYEDDQSHDGVFEWGSSRNELFEDYYDASDLYFMGDIGEARQILQKIVNKDPYFIDAYNLLGTIELESGNFKKGRQHHEKALQIGEQIIPDSFQGNIRWGFTENRPYLRALHSVALDYAETNNYGESIRLMEKILAYNPDDNQGVRYLVGDLYFLQNSFKKAETIYLENPDYPPYLYSYGLLNFVLGNYTKAITSFRKGILNNIYISDFLRAKLPLIPYEIWYSSNFEMPETAYAYADLMTIKWLEYPEAMDILQFLHLTEPSHSEIQQVYMLKGELYFADSGLDDEESYNIREEILDDIQKVEESISDSSSKEIYKNWKNGFSNPAFRDM